MGINLKVRSLENNLKSVLNEFKDVPIEMQRIIVASILDYLTAEADAVTRHELEEYQKTQQSKEVVDNVDN